MNEQTMIKAVSKAQLEISELQDKVIGLNNLMRVSTNRDHTLELVGDINRLQSRITRLNNYIYSIDF